MCVMNHVYYTLHSQSSKLYAIAKVDVKDMKIKIKFLKIFGLNINLLALRMALGARLLYALSYILCVPHALAQCAWGAPCASSSMSV